MSEAESSWARAATCLRMLLFAPDYLAGAVIRMRAAPDRDAITDALHPLAARKLHTTISDEQLFGGIDLSATLGANQLIEKKGIFLARCTALLSMAERCGPELAAKLAHQLDGDRGHCLIALDEGADPEEAAPPALSDRLPFHIAPDGRRPVDWRVVPAGTHARHPQDVTVAPDDAMALAVLATTFGIDSLRAPLLALRVARTLAAIDDREAVSQTDLETAAGLVYPHRATRVPEEADSPEQSTPPDSSSHDDMSEGSQTKDIPHGDMLVDAVRALLPDDVLARLVPAGTTRALGGKGAGQKRKGNRRGRPLPSRPGRLDGRNRIDLVATLRAAAPWQPIRRRVQPKASGLLIRPSDIRVKRYEDRSDRVLIFAVDASGSAAVARLNEAKGAVELLLAQAYAARDHVALISFRGIGAELLLPPTRSLVQTKRRLANLPGGGGTPLAMGLQEASVLALQSRSKGLTPTIVALTDGRANIALDGSANRAQATDDAERMAQLLRLQGFQALLIDTGARPQAALSDLSRHAGAQYLALPRANAHALTGAVSAALEV
ncbi:magnesium chelatase subunit D [uncultured Roseobacter sp.]|uniref:magnesium chelatase subunit D n=1 Tax=uncultured Roseobacter sp. TaxID=114847 RepID=UPI002617C1E5|nr:magnesium chelatase subunit D [uncultured Roseobacter sp.]